MFFFKSKITRRILTNPILYRRLTSLICPPPPSEPIVTVLDATSSVGVNLALLLKQNSHIKELRLYDEDSDTHPLAEDLNDIDTRTKVVPFTCRCLREAIKVTVEQIEKMCVTCSRKGGALGDFHWRLPEQNRTDSEGTVRQKFRQRQERRNFFGGV
jgi:hypothetical protein